MSLADNGSNHYPIRKARILSNFYIQQPQNEAIISNEDDSDEVKILHVVPSRLAVPMKDLPPTLPSPSPGSSSFTSMGPGALPQETPNLSRPKSLPIQLSLRSELTPSSILDPPGPSFESSPVPRIAHSPENVPNHSPQTLKVVQKVADDTWIEINLPYDTLEDGERLKRMSSTIETLATSYRNILSSSPSQANCSCPQASGPRNACHSQLDTADVVPGSQRPPQPKKANKPAKRPMHFVLQDPSDDREDLPVMEKRRCSICTASVESFHLNYGVSSCYSCRAFFRRSVQKNIHPMFVCHFGRRCTLNPYNRSDCRKCRFQKCLDQGMKTTSVLSHGQKMVRFRKHIGLKQAEQFQGNQRTSISLRSFRKPKKQSGLRSV
ncbi:hypothetical protein TCAL_07378 [Tigriopus californicus]|uniref:Nuclear receptor domain-containing protein n=1 Tax=Tigriopus californicus TaxID=6832 RepID=A0A553PNE3_TIGCA|nr:nuclear hormone receptor FTZ-F1 beta-like [Tigriopus californicus]TRY79196.1 hypothetical protein TCAL_07378 [Tigriopus californicus]|eukprot:TCALIF_07378-PA protein Name:"Similar to NR1H3 Oxysterols receptor LXR-alpha (Homo sapiens)" AED:0.41 eAED:0.44 QI:0/-1/0/1/-1/1/1/0/379